MKCKFCKNDIADGSIFCNWCGERQVKERKKKDDIKVPAPRKLDSGKWNIQLRAEGQSITEDTPELCVARAKAIRAGFLERQKQLPKQTLSELVDAYIDARKNTLSPATIRGYRTIQKNRFVGEMGRPVSEAKNWQMIVDREAMLCSVKTLRNSWGLIASVLDENHIEIPKIRLPQQISPDLAWLDSEQVLQFCTVIEGEACELAALMALSSLRRSELCAVKGCDISEDCERIHVRGAMVPDVNHRFIIKNTNKNVSSQRTVPVLIPRLKELLAQRSSETEYLVSINPDTLRKTINRLCRENGLPEVGVHGLRRSFVSLGYHLGISEEAIMRIGGWTNFQTVHKYYLKLSQSDLNKAGEKITVFFQNEQKC